MDFFLGAQDNLVVSVQGGRYDVDIIDRSRTAVYWQESTSNVRRCSWFYKEDGESRFLPYDENFAQRLEVIVNSFVIKLFKRYC